jgi:hypothetical protein
VLTARHSTTLSSHERVYASAVARRRTPQDSTCTKGCPLKAGVWRRWLLQELVCVVNYILSLHSGPLSGLRSGPLSGQLPGLLSDMLSMLSIGLFCVRAP